jgi:hypothetical protein
MFVIGNLSLFRGEVIFSNCIVIHMPHIHIMFHQLSESIW